MTSEDSSEDVEALKAMLQASAPPEVTLAALLQSTPPEVEVQVTDFEEEIGEKPPAAGAPVRKQPTGAYIIATPEKLLFFCDNCKVETLFDYIPYYLQQTKIIKVAGKEWSGRVLKLRCRNCGVGERSFSLSLRLVGKRVHAVKLGQYPSFGGRLPESLLGLAGTDRQLFLQGWRAEKAGLGIGAFAYYRRVVDSQRVKLIDAIVEAARTLGASDEAVTAIESAQFSRSRSPLLGVTRRHDARSQQRCLRRQAQWQLRLGPGGSNRQMRARR